MAYKSTYTGRETDYAIKQVQEVFPAQFETINADISDIKLNKADVNAVPKKLSQLTDDMGYATKAEAKEHTDDLERRLENNSMDDGAWVNWAYYCEEAYSAEVDMDGNDIMETYATKEELKAVSGESMIEEAEAYADKLKSDLTSGSVTVKKATKAVQADEAYIAYQDGEGNEIHETYETKDGSSAKLTEAKAYTDKLKSDLENRRVEVEFAWVADTADSAQCDVNGNEIHTTYATKEELNTAIEELNKLLQDGNGVAY